ncbi:hypothetical protein CARUB_v10025618mg [Capsella rubella]|uniref:Knottin scorpion toxin-like domain-containing protein n=1 Tax=Capsella rubella TaxID=81985 RepID=R0G217_9BRAS|nr:putative defensin-like protein 146 [Capsella rubella]EOA29336.1 hypothetical protein CARUB_v10025618mg [Capsella rubella]
MKRPFQLALTILTFFLILELGVLGQQERRQCSTNIPFKSGKCVHEECKAACTKMHKISASICIPPGKCRCFHYCPKAA